MAGRLRRFLLLERPRAAGAADRPGASSARIAGVERRREEPGEAVAEGHLDRFRPAPERPLELDRRSDGSQPFVRCMRCETDHERSAPVCRTCGADLDLPEQRAFNERLWASRRAESRAEEVLAAGREAERAVQAKADERARRALGETLAREAGDLERRRIESEERAAGGAFGGFPDGSGFVGAPLGVKILRALPDWRWQMGALAAAVAAVGGLVAYGRAGHPFALVLAAVLTIALVVPPVSVRGDL